MCATAITAITTRPTLKKTREAVALATDPPRDCPRCPRLVAFRDKNRLAQPAWFNGAVPSFGDARALLVIVGLAPGLQGANRTGRPFTGDFAGDLLYKMLLKHGLARGTYGRETDDGLELTGALISNAVRCVPPENKPLPAEIATCNSFLTEGLHSLPRLRSIFALGRIAHEAVLRAYGLALRPYPFAHGTSHALPNGVSLTDSYHCSRYNTNTGRLTEEMFEEALLKAKSLAEIA